MQASLHGLRRTWQWHPQPEHSLVLALPGKQAASAAVPQQLQEELLTLRGKCAALQEELQRRDAERADQAQRMQVRG